MANNGAADMKLVVKHTFLEFVDTDAQATGMRSRGFTDSECLKSVSSIASDSTSLPSSSPLTAISEEEDTLTTMLRTEHSGANAQETYACPTPSWDLQAEPTTESSHPPPLVLPPRQSPTSSQPCGLAMMSPMDMSLGATPVGCWPPGYFGEPLPYAAGTWDRQENKPAVGASVPMTCRTTIMLRQLPAALGRDDLIYSLNMMGFAGKFDFVYLPVDFSCGKPLGYAFVNLITPADAEQLWAHFDGFSQWGHLPCSEPCTVTWSDPHQGIEAHIERYRNSPVMHPTVPESWRPAVFKNGQSMPFPHPTRKIKAPKFKHRPQRADA